MSFWKILFLFILFLFFNFHLLPATLHSLAHTSETSAERLALACERVHTDNAMHYVFTAFVWNAAAVIFCKPVIYWQYFRQSRENNLKKTHRPLSRLLSHTPHTWKTHHVLHPEKHQMLGSVTSVRTGWANCLPERHSTKWAVLIRRGLFFFLPRGNTVEQ